ncbi:MAG: hypothetical protein GY811_07550 [Myxococcales bacterium]|nr:hypothetical protein [Myxococcales bacterium]
MAHRGNSTGTPLLLALLVGASMGACATGTEGSRDGGQAAADSGSNNIDAAQPSSDAATLACASEPCFEDVACSEVEGGYQCSDCPSGLEGDGETCSEVDGCDASPCFLGVDCTDVPAPGEGASCSDCPTGFFGNGIICTDIDGCDGDPCFPGATCVDNVPPAEGFTCGTCPTGFEGDGLSCTDIDECTGDPCFGDIECTDAVAPLTGFSCGACPPGTTGDGAQCDLLCDPVSSLACGGQLSASNGGAGSADLVDNWACSSFPHTGPEIVYSFSPDASGIATISLTGLAADLDLLLIEDASSGGLCDPASAGVCVQNGSSNRSGTADEEVRLNAIVGTTYYIIVDGFDGATSNFTLRVQSATEDFLLNEVSFGATDFVEVRNHGACDTDLGGLGILHKASLTSPAQSFVFPGASNVSAGGVMRWVESSGGPFLSNEINAGESILDIPAAAGSTALCNGVCETTNCTNLLDYVERDEDTSDASLPGGPACASLVGGPINAAGQSGEVSLRRTAVAGAGGPYQASDWSFGATSRD